MEKTKVYTLAGSEPVGLYFNYEGKLSTVDAEVEGEGTVADLKKLKDELEVHEFDSPQEAEAFIKGIAFAEGWMEVACLDDEQVNEIKNA